MDFSLSSSLVGNAISNPDKLALDLQFATDKTLTARKGPTPVFTRASSATRVNEAGLIETAPENLILQSENFGAIWTAGQLNVTGTPPYLNVATAPNGTITAEKLIANTTNSTHQFRQDVTLVSGTTYTISAYYKAQETNFATISIVGVANGSADWVAYFNISASSPAVGFFNGFTSTAIVDVGDGWRRCSVTFTTTASGTLNTRFGGASSTIFNSNFYTGDNASGFLIWGAQLEASSTARTYIPTTTAAVYGARFDHDPITLACKGLLIEESRTNLTARSEGLDATPWAVQNATTITSNNTASPDGNVTAELFTVGATSTIYGIQNSSVSWTSGTTYTVSCFFKAREITRVNITVNNTGVLPINATFDLTGSGSIVGTPTGTAVIQRYGNGWYRCSVSATALSTALTAFRFSAVSGTSTTYPGNSVDSFYGWGAQVEVGAFPTSYIPTTTASVVRSADVCSITGSDFTSFYNQSEGTIFASGDPRASATGIGSYVMANSGSNANQVSIYRNSTTNFYGVANSGSYTANIQFASSNGSFNKIAGSYITNDARVAFNNVLGTPDTSVIVPINLIRLNIGSSGTAASEYANGCISAIRYYKKRLSNAKLQTLTA